APASNAGRGDDYAQRGPDQGRTGPGASKSAQKVGKRTARRRKSLVHQGTAISLNLVCFTWQGRVRHLHSLKSESEAGPSAPGPSRRPPSHRDARGSLGLKAICATSPSG